MKIKIFFASFSAIFNGVFPSWFFALMLVTCLSADSYYHDKQSLTILERSKLNFDSPEAIDFETMAKQIQELKLGKTVETPVYDFSEHKRCKDTITQKPTPVIVIEGILILAVEALRKQAKHKIYLDTQLDVCLMRRIRRDCMERGRTVESVLNQYEATVHPMLVRYVLPSRQYATCLFEDGGPVPGALSWLNESIKSHLNSQI